MADKPQADWQRLKYPDEATFDRMVKDYPELIYDGEKNDYRPYVALPAHLRLGWPSEELWHRAARTHDRREAEQIIAAGGRARVPQPWPCSRLTWAQVLEVYPVRPGVAPEEQDAIRVLTLWPDCFGQPLVSCEVTLTKDIITIGHLHYSRGRHRVPQAVAVELRRICDLSMQERLKALIPTTHADEIIATLSGASSAGAVN